MLMLRVITATVLLAVLCIAIAMGPLAFAGVMAVAFGAALYEWLRMGGLGPVPAVLVAAVEMITQFSLYWAGALPRMEWFLFIIDGAVMLAWFVDFLHRARPPQERLQGERAYVPGFRRHLRVPGGQRR